ncbi:DEAD/DEAH box helicase [Aurantimicrobium minutum]|uniref:DEAD/DEAH box helicase n=1 Tax=Aurantimicrobium minutum TaxID=708131 RepID=A0A173LXW1_9MICO|nr:DEAD/DEAH box helicase [Aurantimicrobium minutum]BAU99694.1 Uncharacterized protein AUMI_111520 [Aurantimicrobium minutum]
MSELIPSLQSIDIRDGLVDYLSTTFALADPDAREALDSFLKNPTDGIFKGPYVRLRLPFKAAETGWRDTLDWYEGFPPYGHQAEAFKRLSSHNLSEDKTRPLPTLVTTGTGSGKTEAFLYPILDHVLRAKKAGVGGVKALILYPMNALVNDQSRRLSELITNSKELGGVRAGVFIGEKGANRTKVTADGLITDRDAIRVDPPDILLTNYKMLDRMLLRPADQKIWKQSATSLQYLVVDEFHSYDGAQGTDVAMLLRRLGLALKRYWPDESDLITEEMRARPLGMITPVATSATLGDKGDPSVMISFAETVFGETFDSESVITETRESLEDWVGEALQSVSELGVTPQLVDASLIRILTEAVAGPFGQIRDSEELTSIVLSALYGNTPEVVELVTSGAPSTLLLLAKAHPFIQQLILRAEEAVSLTDLAEGLFPAGLAVDQSYEQRDALRMTFLVSVLAAMSHIRAIKGREAITVDFHLWVRALNRIDRTATSEVTFRWADDGGISFSGDAEEGEALNAATFPAIYCRHCGRSGWGIQLAPAGFDLDNSDTDIRRHKATKEGRFRALIYAPIEFDRHKQDLASGKPPTEGMHLFNVAQRSIQALTFDTVEGLEDGSLPVLTLAGQDADDQSQKDLCPNCQQSDGIRFLGSAIATMLSVSTTTIFSDPNLNSEEKKALVFTDSVQDAAHRAGFIQSRSHVFSLRNAIREAIPRGEISIEDLAEVILANANDPFRRYRLLAPEIVERPEFKPYWETKTGKPVPAPVLRRVKRRIQFDLAMEFGLQSRLGRTLELTGSAAAQVDAGAKSSLESFGRAAVKDFETAGHLGSDGKVDADVLVHWVRGVLEHMRVRGSIEHEWFNKYLSNNGERWWISGGRPRSVGMPAFPFGRDAPGNPRFGSAPAGSRESGLDPAGSSKGWYAKWASKNLGVTPADGAKLTRQLLEELEKRDVISSVTIGAAGNAGAITYQISPSRVVVREISDQALLAGKNLLVCDTCQSPVPGTEQVVDELENSPCTSVRCTGTLLRAPGEPDNYYRTLYNDGQIRRVVAREHTGLLEDKLRLEYENGFKQSIESPDAPNVLVATPTLEMGIDIGDLSTVFLAGLPKNVSSYLQRVGRAGRLTGNSLSLAYVLGRGEQLPKLGDPLSVINGEVRPPATYINANEILQRQFIASVVDRMAFEGKNDKFQEARDVLASTESDSFIGLVIDTVESDVEGTVQAFLDGFDGLSEESKDSLIAWAEPTAGTQSSQLAISLISASQHWTAEGETLKIRKKIISDSLDELKVKAEHPLATDDDKSALKSANASYKLVVHQQDVLNSEFWISSLERFGVLPNYTLLDDNVRLDVGLSWTDPDTNETVYSNTSYDRSAGIAIRELAPGATFYAQGVEIEIDAVDLGNGGAKVQKWNFCPSCGFARDVAVDAAALQTNCPRCGSKGITDANQILDVLELETVSAEVRKEESAISDGRDERHKEYFDVQIAADVDQSKIERQWFVEGTSFGAKLLNDMTIRWVNLGKTAGFGSPRFVSGGEYSAPLFRVCEVCGKLDQKGNVNSYKEHRAWCINREAAEEHTVQLALTRTLKTQGLVLRLPPSVVLGDGLAIPSLSAAIQLGLRELIGGNPDHLRLATIVEPVFTDGSENNTAILIHDAVPGGTGYLTDLASPEQIHDVLSRAWKVVRDCACKFEGRSSCHRCLLPFAPGGSVDSVSRAVAERHLAKLLGVTESGELPEWEITETDPGNQDPESMLEQWFRKVFKERITKLGAALKEIPGPWGNKIQFTIPGNKFVWELAPQVHVGITRPDFILRSQNGGVKPLAIYTDGYAYHASPAINRIADDAKKRRYLKGEDYEVLVLTWDDLRRASEGEKEPALDWFNRAAVAPFVPLLGLSPAALDHVVANPIDQLMDWISDPNSALDKWKSVAAAIPFFLTVAKPNYFAAVSSTEELIAKAISFIDKDGVEVSEEKSTWAILNGPLVVVSRHRPEAGSTATEVALILDDRIKAVSAPHFKDAWQQWLKFGNLLSPRELSDGAHILALSDSGTSPKTSPITLPATSENIPNQWAPLFENASSAEKTLLVELSALAGIPLPELGLEIGDGIPVNLAWSEFKVAVLLEPLADDVSDLQSLGWRVVSPNAEDILDALSAGSEK